MYHLLCTVQCNALYHVVKCSAEGTWRGGSRCWLQWSSNWLSRNQRKVNRCANAPPPPPSRNNVNPTTATIPVRYASLHPPIPTYCKPSAAGPKIHTMVLQNALAYSKLFCCSAKNWIGGYTGDVGWAQYKTVKKLGRGIGGCPRYNLSGLLQPGR